MTDKVNVNSLTRSLRLLKQRRFQQWTRMDVYFAQIVRHGSELGTVVCKILFSDIAEQHSVQLIERKSKPKISLKGKRRM